MTSCIHLSKNSVPRTNAAIYVFNVEIFSCVNSDYLF